MSPRLGFTHGEILDGTGYKFARKLWARQSRFSETTLSFTEWLTARGVIVMA